MNFYKIKPCPMCNPEGWLDEDGQPIRSVTNKYHCEYCGGTGRLSVLEKDDEEEEELYERSMGR